MSDAIKSLHLFPLQIKGHYIANDFWRQNYRLSGSGTIPFKIGVPSFETIQETLPFPFYKHLHASQYVLSIVFPNLINKWKPLTQTTVEFLFSAFSKWMRLHHNDPQSYTYLSYHTPTFPFTVNRNDLNAWDCVRARIPQRLLISSGQNEKTLIYAQFVLDNMCLQETHAGFNNILTRKLLLNVSLAFHCSWQADKTQELWS